MNTSGSNNRSLLIFTGDGKGKSTAAFGMLLRAAGWGMQSSVIQFIKAKKTGESQAAALLPNVEWFILGDGFTWVTQNLILEQQSARKAWEIACQHIQNPNKDLVILDEIFYALALQLLPIDEVVHFLVAQQNCHPHIVMTGRNAPASIIALADTVTEMHAIKHSFAMGVPACKGIEY